MKNQVQILSFLMAFMGLTVGSFAGAQTQATKTLPPKPVMQTGNKAKLDVQAKPTITPQVPSQKNQKTSYVQKVNIRYVPKMTEERVLDFKINESLQVKFDKKHPIVSFYADDLLIGTRKLAKTSFDKFQTDWESVFETLQDAVADFKEQKLAIFSLDGKFTDSFMESLIEQLGNSYTADDIKSLNDISDYIRNDFVTIEAFFDTSVIGNIAVQSAQQVGAEMYAMAVVNAENTYTETYTYFESGSEASGKTFVAVYWGDGELYYTYQKGNDDRDWDNDGTDDSDERDGRGDGDGFVDAVNDLLHGDDGDNITAESENPHMFASQQKIKQQIAMMMQNMGAYVDPDNNGSDDDGGNGKGENDEGGGGLDDVLGTAGLPTGTGTTWDIVKSLYVNLAIQNMVSDYVTHSKDFIVNIGENHLAGQVLENKTAPAFPTQFNVDQRITVQKVRIGNVH